MEGLFTIENLIALATLTSLEVVLGIDNVVFIAILVSKLPPDRQKSARQVGLLLALVSRIALLFSITWVMTLTEPLFSVLGHGFSGRDIILVVGGLFLIAKATHEIHNKIEGGHEEGGKPKPASYVSVILQIMIIDVVFSLDSVITAVGMAKDLWVMVTAVIIAVAIMMIFAERISAFIERHPTFKVLALSFLLLIGVMLVADGCGKHVDKGYIYFAMGFSMLVEMINMRANPKRDTAQSGGKKAHAEQVA
ncbi:MAG: TerC family protein [Deltaproteobacteria bacterium]|nr:TerC family protein [Deltaproteobacteria bacterium]